jgi:hypothetical protein
VQIRVEKEEIGMRRREKFFTVPTFKLRESQELTNRKLFRDFARVDLSLAREAGKVTRVV